MNYCDKFWWGDEKTKRVLGKYECKDVVLNQW